MKACRRCGVVQELSEFYTHPQMGDRHLSFCKACVKLRISEQRRLSDSVRDKERARYQANPERKLASARRHEAANPERYQLARHAASVFHLALARGDIVRPSVCEECGQECTPEGAHYDYTTPLAVRWLCRRCHRRWDAVSPKTLAHVSF